jgi:predicted Rossmann fold flavoprotein
LDKELHFDVVVIGAGASGLICAATAAERGRRVAVLESGKVAGRKVMVSGGGFCNITNTEISPDYYVSINPHFCCSALSRFTQWDLLELLGKGGIAVEERDHGRIFSTGAAKHIVDFFLERCTLAGVRIYYDHAVRKVQRGDDSFLVTTDRTVFRAEKVVVASGGACRPDLGGGDFGFRLARQFWIDVVPVEPALSRLLFNSREVEQFRDLSGISLDVRISLLHGAVEYSFEDALLFTHKGLSGPAALRVSNYWEKNGEVIVDFSPHLPVAEAILRVSSKALVKKALSAMIPARLGASVIPESLLRTPVAHLRKEQLDELSMTIHAWRFFPSAVDGYKVAETSRGGVSTASVSSKTFESSDVPGLFFIGEVLDVTGDLGGYNLQWAWSSGYCAGLHA